jgi:hypothetical protein
VIFIDWILQLFVAQIDGKFLVHGYEAADRVVNFLRESNGPFVNINFFDIASTTTRTTGKFANVPAAAIRQLFPMSEFAFVLGARRPGASRLSQNCG